jgi:transcriptional regulator with XRE-family HTH domain
VTSPTEPEDEIGARLRAARGARRMTLTELSQKTGISLSTLSRLESGQRKATVKLLVPIARSLGTSLDDLVGSEDKADPRVTRQPLVRDGVTIVPLSGSESAIQVFHHTIPTIPAGDRRQPRLQSHEGYEWVYVLKGRVRLMLGSTELVLQPGDAAEFDTKTPHWFGNGGQKPAQYLTIFGPQGEKVHLRARPRR